MTTIHNLGFPRMGARRELKFALESYWRGESSRAALQEQGARLRQRHWQEQAGLDWVPVGDFSFYDQVLDMSFTLATCPSACRAFMATRWTTTSAWRAGAAPRPRLTRVAAAQWPRAR